MNGLFEISTQLQGSLLVAGALVLALSVWIGSHCKSFRALVLSVVTTAGLAVILLLMLKEFSTA